MSFCITHLLCGEPVDVCVVIVDSEVNVVVNVDRAGAYALDVLVQPVLVS